VDAGLTDYISALNDANKDTDVVAFFDLDRTLISGYSVVALVAEQIRAKKMSFREFTATSTYFFDYGVGRLSYEGLLESILRQLRGQEESTLIELGRKAYQRKLFRKIYKEARDLISVHRRLGHKLVLVTSATRYQARPVAEELAIPNLCCTELEISNGLITGNFLPCFGPSKAEVAMLFVESKFGSGFAEYCLDKAFFYTDSADDLPLLEMVGRPVATNAKASLANEASKRGWPQIRFHHTGINLAA